MPVKLRSYVALIIGVVCLGFSAIFMRWAEAPGLVSSFYRMGIGALLLSPLYLKRHKQHSNFPLQELRFALLGGLFFAIDMAFWSTGVMLSGATNPTLLANTAPLWVGLGALLLFKERLTARFWLGLGMAMLGSVFILRLDSLQSLTFGLGTFMGLMSGIFYGGYFLFTQRGRQKLDTITFFWISGLTSTLILFLLSLLFGFSLTHYPAHTYLAFLAMGVVNQVIGWLSLNYAQGHLPASLVAPTLLGQPVLTGILSGPLLGEQLSIAQIISGFIVLLGIYLIHRSRSNNPKAALRKTHL
ncbi:MAG: DMT family transporter [Chloroflexota bacterium]